MGGAGMGEDAYDSVTDAWGRVHGVPWLRVADASLFPDSLEINPYLTIMALADRVAEGIRRDAPSLFGIGTADAAAPPAAVPSGTRSLDAARVAPRR
jgi:choline dehydrogenase-like flavoprotein